MTADIFDVWTDRDDERLRVVVRHGDGIPPYYATTNMKRLGSSKVAADIAADVQARGHYAMSTNVPFDPKMILGDPLAHDRYADADPEELVTVVGVGPMTLRAAVKGYIAACEKAADTAGILLTMVAREVGKNPSSFLPEDMDRLAEMERFR